MKSYTLPKEDFLGEDKEFNSVTAKQALSTDHLQLSVGHFQTKTAWCFFLVFFCSSVYFSHLSNVRLSVTQWILEPRHDKTNRVSVRPAKTQISLGIRPVWSVFAGRMTKAWVFSYPLSARWRLIRLGGWAHSHFVGFGFVMSWLNDNAVFSIIMNVPFCDLKQRVLRTD